MNNLIGQKFNRLLVIEEDSERTKSGQKKWICKCDCGNIKSIIGSNLKNGATKSCGCLHKEKITNNLIGQRFGKLLVIEKTDKRTVNRGVIWRCKCDCGNIIETNTNNLQQKYINSCGCLNQSIGEYEIAKILLENKIPFETEKTFDGCMGLKNKLRFDFYVNNEYLIEYDGEQHFESIKYFGGDEKFLKQSNYDKIKNNWCKENNIPLIRIPHTHIKDITLNDLLLGKSQYEI